MTWNHRTSHGGFQTLKKFQQATDKLKYLSKSCIKKKMILLEISVN